MWRSNVNNLIFVCPDLKIDERFYISIGYTGLVDFKDTFTRESTYCTLKLSLL